MDEIQFSQARAELPDLHEHALAHLPTRIVRRRSDPAVLLSEEDFKAVLSRYEFHPEVLFEEGAVAIWLPELAIWGRGESFASAKKDLLEEIDQLLAVVTEDNRVRNAPNMTARRPWIFRLLGVREAEWEGILFAQPSDAERRTAALAVSV
jgi:PHD/YefM family antitoxin component YafN of YafNO toxin-antitoxin module